MEEDLRNLRETKKNNEELRKYMEVEELSNKKTQADYLKLREEDFQLKKEKKKYYYTYSLANAAVFDVSDKESLKIMVSSSLYKVYIKPLSISDKQLILSGLEKIVRKKAAETAFSNNYQEYKKEIAKTDEKNPYDALLFKLNTFQLLKDEIGSKMTKFKTMIQQNLSKSLISLIILLVSS